MERILKNFGFGAMRLSRHLQIRDLLADVAKEFEK